MLEQFYDALSGDHFSTRTFVIKIMRVGYYWLTLFNDSNRWVRKCKKCAFFSRKQKLATLPLHPIQVDQPFTQWGLDFIGVINPPSNASHKWILATIDYFTSWIEVVALKDAIEASVLEFLDGIATMVGVPSTIILNNAKAFVGAQISSWLVKHEIYLKTSSNYYPQGNGLDKSSNKIIIGIIKRAIKDKSKVLAQQIKDSLMG